MVISFSGVAGVFSIRLEILLKVVVSVCSLIVGIRPGLVASEHCVLGHDLMFLRRHLIKSVGSEKGIVFVLILRVSLIFH